MLRKKPHLNFRKALNIRQGASCLYCRPYCFSSCLLMEEGSMGMARGHGTASGFCVQEPGRPAHLSDLYSKQLRIPCLLCCLTSLVCLLALVWAYFQVQACPWTQCWMLITVSEHGFTPTFGPCFQLLWVIQPMKPLLRCGTMWPQPHPGEGQLLANICRGKTCKGPSKDK